MIDSERLQSLFAVDEFVSMNSRAIIWQFQDWKLPIQYIYLSNAWLKLQSESEKTLILTKIRVINGGFGILG